MKIQSSAIEMSGKSSLIQNYSKEESLKTWVGNNRPDFEQLSSRENRPSLLPLDELNLSDEAKQLFKEYQKKALAVPQEADGVKSLSEIEEATAYELRDEDKLKIQMLEKMIEFLTGKKIKFKIPKKVEINPVEINIEFKNQSTQQAQKGWGLEYDYHESYYEQEKMSFSAEGIIKTQDGKEINFSVQLNMSREFFYQKDLVIRAGDAKIDPLVINYDGNAASLTETKFSFDLDTNGTLDQISFVGSGSGFLALDKNNDGRINDGKELFGPQSGNGFEELAQFDMDNNHWIDENDPIFNRLRIWTKDSDGKDQLFALGEKGIGAIYLGNVSTDFGIKDQNQESQGDIRKTGIFVKENSTVGTIQHIDLAI